jgi:uncharacterized protein
VKEWFEKTILGLNLCPFARIPYERGLVRLTDSEAKDPTAAQHSFLSELEALNDQTPQQLSTILLGFPLWKISFEDFLDFAENMEGLVEEVGISDDVQLVVFHPQFRLDGFPRESFAHWPNSSPYPVLHLLRRPEVVAAATPERSEQISLANEAVIEQLNAQDRKKFFPWKF